MRLIKKAQNDSHIVEMVKLLQQKMEEKNYIAIYDIAGKLAYESRKLIDTNGPQMKVAYNAKYGGFDLSQEAKEMFAELKGIDINSEEFKKIMQEMGYGAHRHDKALIQVVETLQEKVNAGSHCYIALDEVPEGMPYTVHEEDGLEQIEY